MKLQDILDKTRSAEKIIIRQEGSELFCGNVNQCRFQRELAGREVEKFYTEMLGGLIVILDGS